jgi:2-oxoisovalerate dehydrogenase E1 component
MGVHWALALAKAMPDVDMEIVDLRSLVPLDEEAIFASVRKTGRAIVLHEDTLFGGIGGEISAMITEHCFKSLDAPVLRCASMDTPVPFTAALEAQFLANSRLKSVVEKSLNY